MLEARGEHLGQSDGGFGVGPAEGPREWLAQAQRQQRFGLLHRRHHLIDNRDRDPVGDAFRQPREGGAGEDHDICVVFSNGARGKLNEQILTRSDDQAFRGYPVRIESLSNC